MAYKIFVHFWNDIHFRFFVHFYDSLKNFCALLRMISIDFCVLLGQLDNLLRTFENDDHKYLCTFTDIFTFEMTSINFMCTFRIASKFLCTFEIDV